MLHDLMGGPKGIAEAQDCTGFQWVEVAEERRLNH